MTNATKQSKHLQASAPDLEPVIESVFERVPECVKAEQQPQSWADKLKEGYAELKAEGTVRLPTIVYSSRTHSQLAQVMKELRNTSYRYSGRL